MALFDPHKTDLLITKDSENIKKHRKMIGRKLSSVVFKVILGLLFIGLSSVAVLSTLKLQQISESNKHHFVKVKRDIKRVSRSNITELLQKMFNGKYKRNLQSTENPTRTSLLKKLLSGKDSSGLNINVGLRNDYRLQQCEGSYFKHTFPDVDYAFFGYDILKGYPLEKGIDPGFTFPIFKTDYSQGRQTSDCRYKVPNGIIAVPGVSCVTSFSSTTIQNKYELSKALAVSASANADGYGVSFSASAGYKKSSSELSSGEFVKILSTAKCNYYFTKLEKDNIPLFTDSFISWVKKLNNTKSNQTYLDFFHQYGTHYLTYTSFGARFTYEHTMHTTDFQKKEEQGIDVGVRASYSGAISAGAGFNMDSSQKEESSTFTKSVTTKTIAMGAPPPGNGDAMTWASNVKQSPVPMKYKLDSIINLFADEYMKDLNVDNKNIADHLTNMNIEYCKYLKSLGKLDVCEPLQPGLILKETRLYNHYKYVNVLTYSACVDLCEEDINCLAITYCTDCNRAFRSSRICFMFSKLLIYSSPWASDTEDVVRWDSVIFTHKIPFPELFRLKNTAIKGITRLSHQKSQLTTTADKCFGICLDDPHCIAFSFSDNSSRLSKCQIYAGNRIKGLKDDKETSTFFLTKHDRYRYGNQDNHLPAIIKV